MSIVTHKVNGNRISQTLSAPSDKLINVSKTTASWENAFLLNPKGDVSTSLRPAQRGALFSIKAHWTVTSDPATIVMPTGTGKTETMIAAVVSEAIPRTLIVVPSNLLRKQTAEKFQTFGILQDKLNLIKKKAIKPAVATLQKSPKTILELEEIINKSNIIVTTMSLLQRFSDDYLSLINERCNALVVDEAHHIPANTWTKVKHKLRELNCLQFTATPFRNDGRKIDGKIIYNFPLSIAQQQGFFKEIDFIPISEFDEEKGDDSIATKAVEKLEDDLKAGYEHIILVRAKDKNSANHLYDDIYNARFKNFNPVLIHSGVSAKERSSAMAALKNGSSRIVVCVDMFGEGIDIPNLKIAAVHDKYKSLPITLQFIGRFARSSKGLGNASVITNIANDDLHDSLKELYSQDSDWNILLHMLASKEIDKEISLQELVQGFDTSTLQGVNINQLRPKISMVAYNVSEKKWNLDNIRQAFDSDNNFITVNEERRVIIIIEKLDSNIEWTSFRGINDTNWQLHLIYWNPEIDMAFVNSTNKSIADSLVEMIFTDSKKVNGETVFRCLHGIRRLMLGTVGLKSAIDGPIRYRMFAGIDIGDGIKESQKETSFKSNLFGVGYTGEGKISIGCSYKGRVWSKWVESIDYWIEWCNDIALRLKNNNIDTTKIFRGALIPRVVKVRPSFAPYGIEWPIDMDLINDESIFVKSGSDRYPIYDLEIKLSNNDETGPLRFIVGNDSIHEEYKLEILDGKFKFKPTKKRELTITKGKREYKLDEFFDEFPPLIKFTDQSTLEGNLLIKMPSSSPAFDKSCLMRWDWKNVDIRKESQGIQRNKQSIQYYVIQELLSSNKYCVVFDDDGSGEVADIVSFSDEEGKITVQLYHCKYSHGDRPGSRVSDLYEVCGQAEKSIKWCQDPASVVDRLIKRERLRAKQGATRFEVGDLRKLREIKNKMRVIHTKIEIFIVQPGVDSNALTNEMTRILSGTSSYLMDTYGINLQVICS